MILTVSRVTDSKPYFSRGVWAKSIDSPFYIFQVGICTSQCHISQFPFQHHISCWPGRGLFINSVISTTFKIIYFLILVTVLGLISNILTITTFFTPWSSNKSTYALFFPLFDFLTKSFKKYLSYFTEFKSFIYHINYRYKLVYYMKLS